MHMKIRIVSAFCMIVLSLLCFSASAFAQASAEPLVKIFGSGGLRGLEAYQTGILISDDGYILTAWSYVLDQDGTRVVTHDGERFDAKLVGHDSRLEIAVLKIDAKGLSHFNIDAAVDAKPGTRIRAFTNCYGVATGDEPVSVQQGAVVALTKFDARRGKWKVPFDGNVLVLDTITSNPGAAGGVVTTLDGQPVALIGKESRDNRTGAWLNYAVPFSALTEAVTRILSGKQQQERQLSTRRSSEPMAVELLGFSMVPDVVGRTPPFVDSVFVDGVAAEAGVRADDLIVDINGIATASCRDVTKVLGQIDRDEPVRLMLQRGSEFVTIELSLVKK